MRGRDAGPLGWGAGARCLLLFENVTAPRLYWHGGYGHPLNPADEAAGFNGTRYGLDQQQAKLPVARSTRVLTAVSAGPGIV